MTRDIADQAKCGLPTLRTRSTSPSHNNDFDRVLLEQRVIVAEMLPSDRLMDVRALYEERESVDKERI